MTRPRTSWKPAPARRTPRGLRRILVALDGSPEGEAILDPLRELLAPRSIVLLVHVIPTPPPSSSGEMAGLLRLEEDAEAYLEGAAARLPQARVRWIVETGDPVERLLAAARDEEVDALALTTHARGGLTSLLLGSVARELLRQAGRPIFLVRPGLPAPRPSRRKILVPLDGPEGASGVLRAVQDLAKRTDSAVTLLHVLPAPRVADPVTGFNPIVLRPLELPQVGWLDPIIDLLAHHGIRAEKLVLMGEPEALILREARERDVDLIALPTRGRGGIARLILGSIAEQLVRKADRAVLLFHRVEE
jgi:nucleotide-binding universal stress UspA family protein